jgi:hypothetical protein
VTLVPISFLIILISVATTSAFVMLALGENFPFAHLIIFIEHAVIIDGIKSGLAV